VLGEQKRAPRVRAAARECIRGMGWHVGATHRLQSCSAPLMPYTVALCYTVWEQLLLQPRGRGGGVGKWKRMDEILILSAECLDRFSNCGIHCPVAQLASGKRRKGILFLSRKGLGGDANLFSPAHTCDTRIERAKISQKEILDTRFTRWDLI
jgi:hypothetical protein